MKTKSGKTKFLHSFFAAAAFALSLAGCGGGAGGSGTTGTGAGGTGSYSVGGSVSGLTGTVVLQNNGGDDLPVSANGSFTFATQVAAGNAYNVTVRTQPTGQTCNVSSGNGTLSGNVTTVTVVCSASGSGTSSTYSVGGTISGLSGSVVLQNNAGDDLTVPANGNFTFATKIANGNTYNVTVRTQPVGQTCTVSTGWGVISGNNVTNVAVMCSTNTYRVWGVAYGLRGSVVLQNNNGDNLTLTASGSFSFPKQLADGSPYSVTVLTQPAGQTCSVANGTGTIAGFNVTDVAVTCASYAYTIGGTVTGLNGSMTLQDNGSDNLTVSTNGSFSFATAVTYGNPYNVTVLAKPVGQICMVTGGSGTAIANVTNVAVDCSTMATMGGAVQKPLALAGTVSTISTTFWGPNGITTDGTNLYVAEKNNSSIRKIVIATGQITLLAGSGTGAWGLVDGTGSAARFDNPVGITTDGTNLYVADNANNAIRQIVIATGAVTTLAGSTAGVAGLVNGTGTAARFNSPAGITTDGTNLYVADGLNNQIRKIVIATGAVTTLAGSSTGAAGLGNGTGTGALFHGPSGITTDGTNLYITDQNNNEIRKIVIATGVVTLFAGSPTGAAGLTNGTGTAALFNFPMSITTDGASLYVTDFGNNGIRQIDITTGAVTLLAGSPLGNSGFADGTGTTALFAYPAGTTTDGISLYVTDYSNGAVRKIQ